MADDKPKKFGDYLCATFPDANAKWVTDSFTRDDRRICLYGVGVAFVQEARFCRMDPVIPCVGPLADLVRTNPQATSFRFRKETKTWEIANG